MRSTLVMAALVVATTCSGERPPAEPAGPNATAPSSTTTGEPAVDPTRPNIVVFMTDDMRVDQTSALPEVRRRLFDEGMVFTQSFVNLPACCPSRATFLTGQHAVHHGVLTNQGVTGGFSAFDDQDRTLPVPLSAAGYSTVFVGKYLNGFGLDESARSTPPGWTDFRALIAPTATLYHSPAFWVNGSVEIHGADVHTVEVMHAMAVDALRAAVERDAPVFAYVSYPAPHAQAGAPLSDDGLRQAMRESAVADDEAYLRPPVPVAADVGTVSEHDLRVSPAFNEADVSDKPSFLTRRRRSAAELDQVDDFARAALESLAAVDRSVAQLMDLLAGASPRRDTWYVFTSDNGLLLGEHRHFGTKYLPYEEAARVPLVIAGPGVDAGSSSAVTSNVDLAPTIAEIAQVTPPRTSDGRSLVPILTGREESRGRAILIQGFDLRPGAPPYRAVHTGDSVYVEWASGERELYDLDADPYQLENLAGAASSAELQSRNEHLLRQLEACAGPPCAAIGAELAPAGDPTR